MMLVTTIGRGREKEKEEEEEDKGAEEKNRKGRRRKRIFTQIARITARKHDERTHHAGNQ